MILALLIALAAAQDTASPDELEDQLKQLEQILLALERVHPEIVTEVSRETHERECLTALRNVTPRTAVPLSVCIRSCADHGVDVENIQAVFVNLTARYPAAMASHSATFWLDNLRDAREELRIQQAIEQAAAVELEQPDAGSSLLDSDSGMDQAPVR